ncbi:MAG: HDIG domain-containing protein [Ignavibacteria bacterium]|nr:HDIG domain-containing protein [Ignavibacteria bacterium]
MSLIKKYKINTELTLRILILLTTLVIITLLFPSGESIEFEVQVGDIWYSKDLIAPFTYPILKDEATYKAELNEAEKYVYPVFVKDDSITKIDLENLKFLVTSLRRDLLNDRITLDSLIIRYKDYFSVEELNFFKNNSDRVNTFLLLGEASKKVSAIFNTGILDIDKNELSKDSITLRQKNVETQVSKYNFYDLNEIDTVLVSELNHESFYSDSLIQIVKKLCLKFVRPNIIFNLEFTEQNRALALSKVSRNIGIVSENEKIVAKHDRITKEIKLRIDSYKIFKAERTGELNRILQTVGKFIHLIVIFTLFGLYLFYFRKKIISDHNRLGLICIVFIIVSVLAYIITRLEFSFAAEYLIFVPVASMLFTIIFDSRVGFYGTVALALVVAGIRGNDYTIALANISAGTLAVFSVRDIKSRVQIFRSILFILLGYSLSIIALGLERFVSIDYLGSELLFALINSTISPVLTYGLLLFFERLFKITTDLTLLELINTKHPLMRELQLKAPGTYHHSVVMSSLAESAADAINANPILAKVGAMYHDIGKLVNSEYFVENQTESISSHTGLDPNDSAEIILKHVEDGIEIAKKYKLPKEVIDFIPMHHGTTTAQYFLTMAKKKKKDVNENLFKYPGPKPQTKETGIVMLADAIESTTRSLNEPDREELEKAIDKVIKSRFDEGQLDESDLTIKDINRIKESFLNILVGIYHQRIVYPSTQATDS